MKTQLDIRADILAKKLQGLTPRQIADMTGLTVAQVMAHDKAITKLMKMGDSDELANMSAEELRFATSAIKTMLPYMGKSLDGITKANITLQSLHTSTLEVAETTIHIIQTRMREEGLSILDLSMLVNMFTQVYEALYNKNGIQIINLLSNQDRDPQQEQLDRHKDAIQAEMDSLGIIDAVVEVEVS